MGTLRHLEQKWKRDDFFNYSMKKTNHFINTPTKMVKTPVVTTTPSINATISIATIAPVSITAATTFSTTSSTIETTLIDLTDNSKLTKILTTQSETSQEMESAVQPIKSLVDMSINNLSRGSMQQLRFSQRVTESTTDGDKDLSSLRMMTSTDCTTPLRNLSTSAIHDTTFQKHASFRYIQTQKLDLNSSLLFNDSHIEISPRPETKQIFGQLVSASQLVSNAAIMTSILKTYPLILVLQFII